jgi:hypothetical protein
VAAMHCGEIWRTRGGRAWRSPGDNRPSLEPTCAKIEVRKAWVWAWLSACLATCSPSPQEVSLQPSPTPHPSGPAGWPWVFLKSFVQIKKRSACVQGTQTEFLCETFVCLACTYDCLTRAWALTLLNSGEQSFYCTGGLREGLLSACVYSKEGEREREGGLWTQVDFLCSARIANSRQRDITEREWVRERERDWGRGDTRRGRARQSKRAEDGGGVVVEEE